MVDLAGMALKALLQATIWAVLAKNGKTL